MSIDKFTKEQLDIYTRVKTIEDRLIEISDPTQFVLNPEIQTLIDQLVDVQGQCSHIFEDGFCVICGRPE